MNAIILFAFYFLGGVTPTPNTAWKTSFDEAKAEAAVSHKYILLSFPGLTGVFPVSKWKRPCLTILRLKILLQTSWYWSKLIFQE